MTLDGFSMVPWQRDPPMPELLDRIAQLERQLAEKPGGRYGRQALRAVPLRIDERIMVVAVLDHGHGRALGERAVGLANDRSRAGAASAWRSSRSPASSPHSLRDVERRRGVRPRPGQGGGAQQGRAGGLRTPAGEPQAMASFVGFEPWVR